MNSAGTSRWARLAGIGLLLFVLAGPRPAAAQEEPRHLTMAVYSQDLALVREVRPMRLSRGEQAIVIDGLPRGLDPSSVSLIPAGGSGLTILEQLFEYDVLDANEVLEAGIGQAVEVVLASGDTLRGDLLARGADLVLTAPGDRLILVKSGEIASIRVPRMAGAAVTEPRLHWLVRSDLSGMRELEIQYLTRGISWQAEYVAVLDEPAGKFHLNAAIQTNNRSGRDFRDADVSFVAGDIHMITRPRAMARNLAMAAEMKVQADVVGEAAFEYHVYQVGRPVTLDNNQLKQIGLFARHDVPYTKEYILDSRANPYRVGVVAAFRNDEDSNLGLAMPAGRFRAYSRDRRGRSLFLGEDRIRHTPVDERVKVELGGAFDVSAERKLVQAGPVSPRSRQESHEIRVRNHKESAIAVRIIESFDYRSGDSVWKLVSASHEHVVEDARTIAFSPVIQAGGELVLTYTIAYSW